DLQGAVASLDIHPALAEGHDLWRTRQAGGLPAAAGRVAHLARAASSDLADREAACVFAAHARIAVGAGARRGTWLSSGWLDDAGRALSAADQQLGFSDGWYGTVPDAAGAATVADALVRQIDAVARHEMAAPVVHVLHGA